MNSDKSRRLPSLKKQSRYLRKNATTAEKHLWQVLRNRNLGGYKFRRQVPLGKYIVDFYCQKSKPVIELDGDVRAYQQAADHRRTDWLESRGLAVIRFTNDDVTKHRDVVADEILRWCEDTKETDPSPKSSPSGEDF